MQEGSGDGLPTQQGDRLMCACRNALSLVDDYHRIHNFPHVLKVGNHHGQAAMDIPTSRSNKPTEWDDAWEIVCRLGASRDRLSVDTNNQVENGVSENVTTLAKPNSISSIAASGHAASDSDELVRAMADIEQATAALRRAEPDLEAGAERTLAPALAAGQRSVLGLIGLLWTSTMLVTTGVVFAIVALLR